MMKPVSYANNSSCLTAALTKAFVKLNEQSHETVPVQLILSVLHTPEKNLSYNTANLRHTTKERLWPATFTATEYSC